jgi:hypothetical protein
MGLDLALKLHLQSLSLRDRAAIEATFTRARVAAPFGLAMTGKKVVSDGKKRRFKL